MKNVVVTAVITAVLMAGIALAVGEWACNKANDAFDAKDAEIEMWKDQYTALSVEFDGEITDKQWQDAIDIWEGRVIERDAEIAEWEACAERRNAEPNEPITTLPTPEPPLAFTDLVQKSLKGVVHLEAPSWQGSGFVVGPRLIVTARHCVEGVEDFVLTTWDDHQVRATRAISDKEHDIGFIWVDDLTCIAEERGTVGHEVVLHPLHLGSIEDCVLGDRIFLIGSPLGAVHFNALTVGFISKLNTRLEDFGYPEDYGWASITTIDAVALDGNSGCPVFNMTGRVIGILVGGNSDALNWVVPVDVFVGNVDAIELAFVLDQYQREALNQSWEVYEEWPGFEDDELY